MLAPPGFHVAATIRVGQGRDLAAWFSGLHPLQRLEVITKVETRQRQYRDRLVPPRLRRGPRRDVTPTEAQAIVVLECFYEAALHLLQAEHLVLRNPQLSPQQATTLEHHKDAFAEEMLYLAPVVNEGYWVPLKQRWSARLAPPPPPPRSDDPWERLEAKVTHQAAGGPYARLDATHDLARARALVEMVPDRTLPVDPLSLEEQPLFPK